MGILKHLLFWPVTGPAAMARFSLGQVDGAVRRELTDDAAVKEALLELQLRLELGEVDEEEYIAREAELMQRLRETRRWREHFGMQEAWRPLGSGTSAEGSADPVAEAGTAPSPPVRESASVPSDPEAAPDPPASGAPGLLARLPRRFTFVVGKGGVGKTTTAGALAVALADTGRTTHLVSTDPAHSVGDLFRHPLPAGVVVTLPDAPRLTVEEFDAGPRGRAWLDRTAAGAGELIERGTYLDADDAAALVEPALPGLGEVVAAIRLVELEQEGAERIVVDTAPTGHALRLLECGAILEGWAEALDAMNEKAKAVHERLVRQSLHLEAGTLLEDLREHARHFEERILPEADFLVVSGHDPIVRAESERLVERLGSMGCRVALRFEGRPSVTSGREQTRGGPEGVAALRRWWREREEWSAVAPPGRRTEVAAPRPAPTAESYPPAGDPGGSRRDPATGVIGGEAAHSHATTPDLRSLLDGRRLLFFAGKGGVGKSTCAAACAVAFARERPVLLLGVDPAGSLGDLLGAGPGRAPRLEFREVDSEREFRRFRERYLDEIRQAFGRLGLDGSVPLDRRVMESLLSLAPPGIDEIFGLRALLEGALAGEDPDADRRVIVDTAPTGHFLRLLEMPEPAIAWSRAVMRLVVKYRAVLGLEELAPGLLEFARDLRALVELLGDPSRTGVVVVTLEEAMVRSETDRLMADLEARGIPVALVLVNRHGSGSRAHRKDPTAEPDVPRMAPIATAPGCPDPPAGPEALADFFSRWQMVP